MIDIKLSVKNTSNWLNNVATKQIPFAAANTLNNVAFGVKDEEVKALDTYLDRPTPFTKRGYEVVKANRNRLVASVRARQAQAEYLKFQVGGGSRTPKKTAIVLPRATGLNKFGNMPRGRVKSLMNQKTVFSGKVNGVGGIWRRTGGKSNPGLKLLVRYTGEASYRKILPFANVAEVAVGKLFAPEFNKQLARALATSR